MEIRRKDDSSIPLEWETDKLARVLSLDYCGVDNTDPQYLKGIKHTILSLEANGLITIKKYPSGMIAVTGLTSEGYHTLREEEKGWFKRTLEDKKYLANLLISVAAIIISLFSLAFSLLVSQ